MKRSKALVVCVSLGLVTILPGLMAAIAYHFQWFTHQSTTNRGVLLKPPVAAKQLAITDYDGNQLPFDKKWSLVYLTSRCDKACLTKLDAMVRVHLILGKEKERARVVLVTREKLADNERDHLMAVKGFDQVALSHEGSWEQLSEQQIYLVDPKGWFILRYRDRKDTNGMYHDLKQLLKVSKIG